MPGEIDLQSMALEVKGGKHVGISVLRELRGVLEDDRSLMAGLIVMHPPGDRQAATFGRFRPMRATSKSTDGHTRGCRC